MSDAGINRNAYIKKDFKVQFTIAQFSTEAITPQNKNYAQANIQRFDRNNEPFLLITRDFPNSRVFGSLLQRVRD